MNKGMGDMLATVDVRLGAAKKPVREIMNFARGSIIRLDRKAGEYFDVYVNDRLVAHGEIVVIDENMGVRITDIIN